MEQILIRYGCITLLAITTLITANAQTDRNFIRRGNRLFHQQNITKAEVEYRKALAANPANPQALYNLACALEQQQKDSAAMVQLEAAAKVETAKLRKAKIYHNMGVICQKHRMFSDAIKAYQEALRNNPADDETRYNLALCKRQQKEQKNSGGGNNSQQNKEKQNSSKNKPNKSPQKNQRDKQQQVPQEEGRMDSQTIDQLLNAARQNEKAVLERMKNANRQPQRRILQKNW